MQPGASKPLIPDCPIDGMGIKMVQVGIFIDTSEYDRCAGCNHTLKRHKFFMEEHDGWEMGETVFAKCTCKNCKCDGPLSAH